MTEFQALSSDIEDLKDLVRSLGDKFDQAAIPTAIAEIRKDVTALESWTGLDEGKRSGRASIARWRDNLEGTLLAVRVLNIVTATIIGIAAVAGYIIATGPKP